MHGLSVISLIAYHSQQWLLGRNLRQRCCVNYIARSNPDSPSLQHLRINADVQFTPLAVALWPMLFGLALAVAQELNFR